jgi:putative transferase (TIGR04331 family)
MFLATTSLTEFWDESDQILFLGPWCLSYEQEAQWLKLGQALLPNPWDDRQRLLQSALYASVVSEQVLTELAALLNTKHDVTFSKRYWRILLGPWLSEYISVLYNYYVHLLEAFKVFPEIRTWMMDEAEYVTPWDYIEYRAMQQQGKYNLQLFSHILDSLGYVFPQKRAAKSISVDEPKSGSPNGSSLKNLLHNIEVAFLQRRFPAKNEVVLLEDNVDRRTRLKLIATHGFSAHYAMEKFPPHWRDRNQPALEWRQELSLPYGGEPFSKIVMTSLGRNIPRIYLEDFKECREWMLARYRRGRFPKVLLNLNGLIANEYGKFLAAEITERGGKILTVQQGGGYGLLRFPGVERHEREISDKFYCWGWAGLEPDPKLDNLPSAKLSNRQRERGSSSFHSKILLMGTAEPRYLNRFQSSPTGRQWEKYVQDTLHFLKELDPKIQGEVLYRGFMFQYGWDMDKRIKTGFPQVKMDDHSRSFQTELRKSRLVVVDHPGTTFLEAVAANVPTLLFFDPCLWEMRDSALPFLDSLRQIKILHDTPESAAAQVSEVYHTVDKWWFSESVQQVRNDFVRHFALNDLKWNRHWLKAIRRESIIWKLKST